jgi:2-aminobenzoate-CoA ligase
MYRSGHRDSFARDNLPPPEQWPDLIFDRAPGLVYPERLNAAVEFVDRWVERGLGGRVALRTSAGSWTYALLADRINRIARVLVDDLGFVPGNRVLLRGPNNPMMAACCLAVWKAGGVAVNTMPLLRARELGYIIDKARVRFALCDARFLADLEAAKAQSNILERLVAFNTAGEAGTLEALIADKHGGFSACDTAQDDVALIAFTSGTTGPPKGTMHFHRDLLAICDTTPRHVIMPSVDDIFVGSPPFAFTFGLGVNLLFPLRMGASAALVEQPSPANLLAAIAEHGATILSTAPTAYRAMLDLLPDAKLATLRKCVSAGEHLPLATFEAWRRATGIAIIDGIGATEMLHIFIAAAGADIRPGATGKVVPGYEARVVDDNGNELPPGQIGRLAVRGPTGCRYLADERQRAYVKDGWNYTGDAFWRDADGYFWYAARTDDMIVSAGYNISGPEVENVLLDHPKVKECGVVAAPDAERGAIVKAYVVLRDPADATAQTVRELQEFVKREIAPYKYPRAVEFVAALPRTETGKLQRFRLRQMAAEAGP